MAEHYRIRIKRGDAEIEVESNEKVYVDSKINEHLPTAFRDLTKKTLDKKEEIRASEKSLSLQEFVKKVGSKGGTEMVLAIAYFNEKYAQMPEMKTRDIKKGFQTVRFKHSNPAQAVAEARTAGYLMDGESKGCFVVTTTGEQWIEERLRADEGKS